MSSESLPKEFEKTTEVLPFTKYGLSSIEDFKKAEKEIQHQEWLMKVGLTSEEIQLYLENEAGINSKRNKIEANILNKKIYDVYSKINNFKESACLIAENEQSASSNLSDGTEKQEMTPLSFYPTGHPMNNIKDIDEALFGHLKDDKLLSITKRRKILRRLERKKQRIIAESNEIPITLLPIENPVKRPGSLWDVKELPHRTQRDSTEIINKKKIVGPKLQTNYTIKDNKIVRLEPVNQEEYKAVDIVVPVNGAEANLLEGTKLTIDDIRKIERFKDYDPGTPSKVLYLKNIASSVSKEQLLLLFNQFALNNGGPLDVRLMTGRMRGQAFIGFQSLELATQALEATNGTIVAGKPIIAQFGRNTNRIQDDNR